MYGQVEVPFCETGLPFATGVPEVPKATENAFTNSVPQMEDRMLKYKAQMEKLYRYLATRKYWDGASENEKRNIRQQSKKHVIENGTMFYLRHDKRKREVITSVEKAKEIVREKHVLASGVHIGIFATLNRITPFFWWNGMREAVEDYVNTCSVCQGHRQNPSHPLWTTKPNETTDMTSSAVCSEAEILNSIPETSRTNKMPIRKIKWKRDPGDMKPPRWFKQSHERTMRLLQEFIDVARETNNLLRNLLDD